jgi:hypothetical protein
MFFERGYFTAYMALLTEGKHPTKSLSTLCWGQLCTPVLTNLSQTLAPH